MTSAEVANQFFGVEHTIGATCRECGLCDYLPFKCRSCGHTYCAEHRKVNQHDCPSLKTAADDEARWQKSTSHGTEASKKKRASEFYKCRHKGCRTRSPIKCICPKCNKNFCVAHRLTDMHRCSVAPPAQEKTTMPTGLHKSRPPPSREAALLRRGL